MDEHEMEVEGHSEQYFTESRDHWYNGDFLDLMARRWGLSRHRTLLDVGAGMCHWCKLLSPYLSDAAEVTAVDFDSKWVSGKEEAATFFSKKNIQFEYLQADAHRLPFPDDSFDVVTCQTVLIHLSDPELALGEMRRVVRPGGIVICVEPNNRVQFLLKDSVTRNENINLTLERVKLGLAQEKIKKLDGDGDDSFGDLLAGTMNRLGFQNIQSYLNDKLIPLFPPYASTEQQAVINNYLGWERDDRLFDKERDFLEDLNKNDFQRFLENYEGRFGTDRMLEALKANAYHNGGASLMYLVSGTKG